MFQLLIWENGGHTQRGLSTDVSKKSGLGFREEIEEGIFGVVGRSATRRRKSIRMVYLFRGRETDGKIAERMKK